MPAKLVFPVAGSTNVDPNTEIVLAFEGVTKRDWEKDVFIKIDGEWAVRAGREIKPFRVTRSRVSGGFAHIGVRRSNGLKPRDIMVQGCLGRSISTEGPLELPILKSGHTKVASATNIPAQPILMS